ncbi:hypothetical protein [Halococcus thailandensis]|uniref:Uncharacterized protein n=1 Tax=Halococcus thailandensis JCM 13552 TaxID=1227457 RepID=M0N2I9_9EURY|nr:hypothetical protein [Halococcus thailandensis]EMA52157.1 hypothetical protein C451_12652 [Halococcus thailandensis JCM 13552]
MIDPRAVVAGSGVALAAAVVGATVPVPELLWPLAIGLVLAVGLGCGFVAGRRSTGRWRSRACTGALAGFLGGTMLAIALWASMSNVLPRAEYSPFWLLNALVAANPIGIERAPWLYTGTTLFWPLLAVFACLFAIEGYVAGGATSGRGAGSKRVE